MAKAEKRNFRKSQGLVTEELAREIIGSIADPLVVQGSGVALHG